MTRKLYDDFRLTETESRVISCEPAKGGFSVLCEETNFFPGGGGQTSDPGTLDGMPVLNVFEKNGNIYHLIAAPTKPGRTVKLSVDRQKRLSDSHIHTGEHMLSGLAQAMFGARNVGFHMSADASTADFDIPLSPEQLSALERAVNSAIRDNRPVKISYPAPDELESLPLRKRPEINEPLRVVEVEGCDLCACCGTHVRSTGEVGILKITSSEKLRGGTRVFFVCGQRAFDVFCAEHRELSAIAKLFSAQPSDVLSHVQKQRAETARLKAMLSDREKRLASALARRLFDGAPEENGERAIRAEIDLGPESLIDAAEALVSLGRCHALLSSEGRYVLASSEDSTFDLKSENDRLRASGAKGGGRGHLFSGKL